MQHEEDCVMSKKPDAFSGGSLTSPKFPDFSLATAAVWWPGRSLHPTPLTTLERDYGRPDQQPTGLAIGGHIQGYDASSTRAELLGVILALFSPRCCHLALYSSSVLFKARRIQSWLSSHFSSLRARLPLSANTTLHHRPLGKPFALCSNRDLWHVMYRALLHRGHNTIRFTKIKGHALEDPQYMRENPELRDDAIGNDCADKAAKRVREACLEPAVIQLKHHLSQPHAFVH